MRIENDGISVMLKLTPETLAAHMERKLKGSRLIYSNKARIKLVGFQGESIVTERNGVLYFYSLKDGKVQNKLQSDIDQRNYSNIRVLTYFKNEKDARLSQFAPYVLRWNRVHGEGVDAKLKKDALLYCMAALENQVAELRKQIQEL